MMRLALVDYAYDIVGNFANRLIVHNEACSIQHRTYRFFSGIGVGRVGVRPHDYVPFERSKRWSILPAYTKDGMLTWDIQHGSFTAELFEHFIEFTLLPFCTPFPGPRSIIVMES